MSAHRNKRPFQPSITSYFARADRFDADTSPSLARNQPQHQGLAPVPVNVQASLLNVGMRVRKSVPEGYKTHKSLPPTVIPSAQPLHEHKPQATFAPAPSNSRPTELLPFCGIHKTGGYDVQQPHPSYFHHDVGDSANAAHAVDAHAIAFSAEDFGLSSQESNASTLSTDSLPTNKRRFEDEDDTVEHELVANMDNNGARPLFPSLNTSLAVPAAGRDTDDLQISPRTVYPVSHTIMPNLGGSVRPLARPKSRKRNDGLIGGGGGRRQAVDEDPLDFEEADFLRPPSSESWGDNAEVEMGGV